MRIEHVSYLTGYMSWQIRERCTILADSGIPVRARIKTRTQFDDYFVMAVEMLLECKGLEENGYSPGSAAREVARRHKKRSTTLSIPPLLAASFGCLRLTMWLLFFEGRTPASASESRMPVRRQIP